MIVLNGVILFAHAETGYGWGGPIEPWEFHPMLVHFPIAFLLAGVALDVYSRWRVRSDLSSVVNGLLIAGVLTGVFAALAGGLAFFVVPAHTEEAHRLMYWHLVIQAAALLLFAWPAWVGWRNWKVPLTPAARVVGWVAASLLMIGSGIGGYIVYHGGAGVAPHLLSREVREGHSHGNGHSPETQHPSEESNKKGHP